MLSISLAQLGAFIIGTGVGGLFIYIVLRIPAPDYETDPTDQEDLRQVAQEAPQPAQRKPEPARPVKFQSAPQSPVKRGRGRPRKQPVAAVEEDSYTPVQTPSWRKH